MPVKNSETEYIDERIKKMQAETKLIEQKAEKMQTVDGLVKKLEAENAMLKNQVKMLSQAIEKNKNLIMYQLEMIYDKEVAMMHDQAMRERAMKDDDKNG